MKQFRKEKTARQIPQSGDPAGLAVCLKVPGLLFVPGTAAQIYGSYFFFLSSSFSSLNTPFSLTSSRSSAIFRT